jgi:N-acetylglutamate synthase-like GNAT family acetyltransferase
MPSSLFSNVCENLRVQIRLAAAEDIPAIRSLIEESVRGLQTADYTFEQREGALGSTFGVDRRLIEDQTYFVVANDAGQLAACGGWSRRRTLFGSDTISTKDDSPLDPAKDAARIRAFFVHPNWARRGLGTLILNTCETAARAAGFTRLELGATLTGIPLYARHGFVEQHSVEVPQPNGSTLTIVHMAKSLN